MCRILISNCFLKLKPNGAKNSFCKTNKFATSSSLCSGERSKTVKQTFNTPHPPKDPPENYNPTCINHFAFDVPDFIPAAAFRPFASKCEKLGPGAHKCGWYKNPEYYSYHRYSFVTLQTECLNLRSKLQKECNVKCEEYNKE